MVNGYLKQIVFLFPPLKHTAKKNQICETLTTFLDCFGRLGLFVFAGDDLLGATEFLLEKFISFGDVSLP